MHNSHAFRIYYINASPSHSNRVRGMLTKYLMQCYGQMHML